MKDIDNLFIVTGTVDKLWFHNEDTGYKILRLIDKDGDEITCKGCIPLGDVGTQLELKGELTEDDYGNVVLKVRHSKPIRYDNIDILFSYLSSNNIKHIGEKTARKIIDAFGEETHNILMYEPQKLATIKGISKKKAEEICMQYAENSNEIETYGFLAELNISQKFIYKIIKVFKNNVIDAVKENPYELANKIKGIGFKKADEIALNLGIPKDSIFRKKSAIIHVLQEALNCGDTLVRDNDLFERVKIILEINLDYQEYREIIQELYFEDIITLELCKESKSVNIYLSYIFKKEIKVAQKIREMNKVLEVDELSMISRIKNIGNSLDIILDEDQIKAVCKAVTNTFVVITGGPGTGKTTVINTVLKYFLNSQKSVKLVAPTACAAKRMSAVTGYKASTIHRLLEIQPTDNDFESYGRNEDNKLETDVLIIDEASMVDLSLFSALLDACKRNTHIILVGDMNQLPSVSAGNVLRDIIESNVIPVIYLTKIYRQGNKDSQIIKIANQVLNGSKVSIVNDSESDLFFIKVNERNFEEQLLSTITRLADRYKFTNDDIQILIPQKATEYGIEAVNSILQKKLNSNIQCISFGEKVFKLGDKVIHTKNNYIKDVIPKGDERINGVFNGDVGYINAIEDKSSFSVEFDDKYTTYSKTEINEVELAYAITVHKSQGSEYPAVILVLKSVPFNLKMRSLLYTAITRAKKVVVIIGEEKVFSDMVNNISKVQRFTGLKEKLRDNYGIFEENIGSFIST